MQKNYPSVKRLMKINYVDRETALLLREIMKGENWTDFKRFMRERAEIFMVTLKRIADCFASPILNEMKMSAANELLRGSGVECAGNVYMRDGPPLLYVNRGDPYNLTLCLFQGRFVVSSWGDIVERNARLFRDR